MAAASRHAGPWHALSQDFRILTFADREDARLWGTDPAADARAIQDAIGQNAYVHDRLRYLIPAALFAER
ncbi:MAG TPA: hypothetical protein VI365_06420, partial [Trebonia sp.]